VQGDDLRVEPQVDAGDRLTEGARCDFHCDHRLAFTFDSDVAPGELREAGRPVDLRLSCDQLVQ